jgi:hypothetical protein
METLKSRYEFFKAHAGYILGEAAVCAMKLARAEVRAETRGLAVVWEAETEAWDGDCPAPEELLYGAVFKAEDVDEYHGTAKRGARSYAGLGMVGVDSMRDPYLRVCAAELFAEALDGALDEEDAEAAEALAMRATYAAGAA